MLNSNDAREIRAAVSAAALDPKLATLRKELSVFASNALSEVGTCLQEAGRGCDEVVAMSVLLKIGSQLVSASADLLTEGRAYAGAALLRQLVEVEYLAWAFDARDDDAQRWLRSDRNIREEFFRPAKLREAARGKFRGKDYSYHCELGGHPVPTGTLLLKDDPSTTQLLLSDLLGHAGGIWNHFVGWAKRNEDHTGQFRGLAYSMSKRFREWQKSDPLVDLPPPP